MNKLSVMLGLVCVCSAPSVSACDMMELDFLTGASKSLEGRQEKVWMSDSEGNRTTESWKWVSDSTMEGEGLLIDLASLEVVHTESLRLVTMGGYIYYIAKPEHNAMPTAFKLTSCEGGRFVFENVEHDFPKRIEYLKKVGGIDVRVSDGADKGFTLEFQ